MPPLNWNVSKRIDIELEGRLSYNSRQNYARLLCNRYSQAWTFESCHCYRPEAPNCPTHRVRRSKRPWLQNTTELEGNSGLDFDSQGRYLASVTRSGCLTILDFQQLYCCLNGQGLGFYDESSNWHTCIKKKLDIVKWNTSNENEVCCASKLDNTIPFYDIHFALSGPTRILQLVDCDNEKGFSDMVFSSDGDSRLIASAFDGGVYVWDWRIGNLPCMKFIKKVKVGSWKDGLTSVETSIDERVRNNLL